MAPALFVITLLGASALPASAQPKVRLLHEQELCDMMQGSSIQATRASDTAAMVRRVEELLGRGHQFTMIAVEDVPEDWTIASGGGIGGGGAWAYVRERTAKQQLPTILDTQAAPQALSTHIGRKFDAVVRSEAAGAMLTALTMAAQLGVPIGRRRARHQGPARALIAGVSDRSGRDDPSVEASPTRRRRAQTPEPPSPASSAPGRSTARGYPRFRP
jgi:hypothetical protein